VSSLRLTERGDPRGSKRALLALCFSGGAFFLGAGALGCVGLFSSLFDDGPRSSLPSGYERFEGVVGRDASLTAEGCLRSRHSGGVDNVLDRYESVLTRDGYVVTDRGPAEGVRSRRLQKGDDAFALTGEWGRGNVWLTVCRR
jgi:hypothetical protein